MQLSSLEIIFLNSVEMNHGVTIDQTGYDFFPHRPPFHGSRKGFRRWWSALIGWWAEERCQCKVWSEIAAS